MAAALSLFLAYAVLLSDGLLRRLEGAQGEYEILDNPTGSQPRCAAACKHARMLLLLLLMS